MDNFIEKCGKQTIASLFPKDVKNRPVVIGINILHILDILDLTLMVV